MSDNEKLAQERADEAQPGQYAGETQESMHDNVTADRDTNGTSASFERLSDLSGVEYAEAMDEISVENHKDEGPYEQE